MRVSASTDQSLDTMAGSRISTEVEIRPLAAQGLPWISKRCVGIVLSSNKNERAGRIESFVDTSSFLGSSREPDRVWGRADDVDRGWLLWRQVVACRKHLAPRYSKSSRPRTRTCARRSGVASRGRRSSPHSIMALNSSTVASVQRLRQPTLRTGPLPAPAPSGSPFPACRAGIRTYARSVSPVHASVPARSPAASSRW